MMQHEIKEVYTLGMNCIVTALVLTLVVLGLNVRNNFAAARNGQTSNERLYQQYVKYGTYNDTVVTGDEAISIIREFYTDNGITIYMNKDDNNKEFIMDKDIARQNPDKVSLEVLRDNINSLSSYRVWVVYDGYDVKDFARLSTDSKRTISTGNTSVTGICLIRE